MACQGGKGRETRHRNLAAVERTTSQKRERGTIQISEQERVQQESISHPTKLGVMIVE